MQVFRSTIITEPMACLGLSSFNFVSQQITKQVTSIIYQEFIPSNPAIISYYPVSTTPSY